jgi:glutamate 5-kinase
MLLFTVACNNKFERIVTGEMAAMENYRKDLKNRKRIVVKIGSSSLMHSETGRLDLLKVERLVRVLVDMKNSGKDVILVSSGAIAVGRNTLGLINRPEELSVKQACAAIGQAKLMMVYQKIFSEYNAIAAQVLMTKNTITNDVSRTNAENTFEELLKLGVIPVVNENDTVSTYEIEQVQKFGDNDRLSAIVASITGADLLILLSDIDGLYTDDPNKNPDAKFVSLVEKIDDKLMGMGKETSGSGVGTGGMSAKITAAQIANYSGADMVITNGNDVLNISRVMNGEDIGTLFLQHKNENVDVLSLV